MVALLTVFGFIAVGVVYSQISSDEYSATAEIIVQDPRSDSLLNVASPEVRSTMSSERNLADQVSILESAEVADTASELLNGAFSPNYILNNRSIVGSATSNLIEVSFNADDPELARDGADALVDAYLEVRRSQIQEIADVALARVDALQTALDRELDDIQQRISAAEASNEDRQELNTQIDQALEDLNALRLQRDQTQPGSEERALINSQIDEIMTDFAGWQTVLQVERQNSQLAQLLAEQDAAIAERAALTGRRNSIAVDAELAAGGVTLVSPAQTPTSPAAISPQILVAGLAVLGLAVAAAVSYYLSQRRQVISDRSMPEQIIEAPLLAVVPEFDTAGSLTQLPVSAVPESPAAEAFRFAASAIASRSSGLGARSILFTSANTGTGTTTILANTALAAALSGQRVAVVDADLERQRLSRLLGVESSVGMTDVVEGSLEIRDALAHVTVGTNQTISVLQRGQFPLGASRFFNQDSAEAMFLYLAESFDLVLIDAPALLRVAYASTLARAADSAVLVVDHGSTIDALEDAADRLELVDTLLLGYIYTKAPIKAASRYRGSAPRRDSEKVVSESAVASSTALKRIGDIEVVQQIRSPDQGHSHW